MESIAYGGNGKDAIEYVYVTISFWITNLNMSATFEVQRRMMDTPIKITEKAATQIDNLMANAPDGAVGLRLTIKSTGCSGNSYKMEYVSADDDLSKDEKFEQNGAGVYIPKLYSWMLFGTEIDYITDELGNSRFDFINPNETGRCGCGESFTVGGALPNSG